jgi:excisionase family DNA binding protein
MPLSSDPASTSPPDDQWAAADYTDLDALRAVPQQSRGSSAKRRGTRRAGTSSPRGRATATDFDTKNYLTKGEFLTKVEAGEIVGLSPKTIEREIQRRNLRAYKLASKVRIRRDDLDEWIETNRLDPSVHNI